MRFYILFTFIFLLISFDSLAQPKSDFHRMKIEKETWMPITGLIKGKFNPSFLKNDSFDPVSDSLAIMQEIMAGKFENDSLGNLESPPANQNQNISKNTDNQEDNSEKTTQNNSENQTSDQETEEDFGIGGGDKIPFESGESYGDSLAFARIYAKDNWDAKPIDFTVRKTMLREDTTNLYDVEFEDIVTVSEELSIDCVWVTLTNYYAVWNSERINPYSYNISDFQDTIPMQLYDTTKNQGWSMPLADIRVTSMFGFRRYRWHHGIDLDLDTGDPVYASFDGIVRISRYNGSGYGNFVVLRHYNGLETLYGHFSKSNVEVGQFVKAGEEIGKGGTTGRSTGPHLHYEVRYRGYALDPREIYDFENQRMKTNLFHLKPSHFKHLQTQRQTVWHTIRSGDSLYKIAVRYRTTVYNLCKLNKISSKSTLRVGKKLRIK